MSHQLINAPYLPRHRGTLAPEASWSRSEARYNHHAFTYQPISESTDRFSIPLSLGLYDECKVAIREEDRLYLFEIDSKDTRSLARLLRSGISVPSPSGGTVCSVQYSMAMRSTLSMAAQSILRCGLKSRVPD